MENECVARRGGKRGPFARQDPNTGSSRRARRTNATIPRDLASVSLARRQANRERGIDLAGLLLGEVIRKLPVAVPQGRRKRGPDLCFELLGLRLGQGRGIAVR